VDVTTATSGSFTIPDDVLPGLSAAECGVSGGVSVTDLICAQQMVSSVGCTSSTAFNLSPLTVTLNTQPPPAPVITSAVGLDKKIQVNMQPVTSNVISSTVYFWDADGGQPSLLQTVPSSSNTPFTVEIDNLTDGVTYNVQSYFTGPAPGDLTGPLSNVMSATPQPINGFFNAFGSAGGKTGGGCSSAAGASLILFPAVSLWLVRRRRS
jgi:hypothetical protein